MPQFFTLYWRDIPAQVIVSEGRRNQIKKTLHERFAAAIDRAAMKAKLSGDDDYLAQWRKSPPQNFEGDMQARLDSQILTLEQDYNEARLADLIANGGVDKNRADSGEDKS